MSAADFALKTQEQLIIKTDGREVMKDGERAAIIVPFQAQIDAPKKQIASAPQLGTNTAFFGGGPTTEPPENREYTNRTVRELLSLL